MKKNFILFALMVFLPVLAFAQTLTLSLDATEATYDGTNKRPRIGNTTGGQGYYWNTASYTYRFKKRGTSAFGESQALNTSNNNNGTRFVEAGEYEITVTRGYRTNYYYGSYTDLSSTRTFTINPKKIDDVSITVKPNAFNATGSAITPAVEVVDGNLGKLVEGTDYSLAYQNNVAGPVAFAVIEGKGNYNSSAQGQFLILSNNPGTVVEEADFSDAEITLANNKVVYNGTETAARITNVTLNNVSQIADVDYRIIGYVEEFDPQAETLPTILSAPDHVGDWYVLIADAKGAKNPAKWAAEEFTVTPGALTISLLEIHKIYGDKDPVLTMDNINTWASVNWAPGDGPSNTTIEGVELDRKTLGENAYDTEGNQLSYEYSLKNPSALKAYKKIGDTKYYNYTTIGVGQASTLFIDKADLAVTCNTNNNVNVPDDWKWYNTADPVDANGSFAYKVVSGLKNNDVVQDTEASAIIKVTREPGEEATQDKNGTKISDGYAFIADAPNYNVTFQDKFNIRRQDAQHEGSAIQVTYTKTQYVYTGGEQKIEPTVSYVDYKTGTRKNLVKDVDYTLAWSNNVNVGTTATCTVTFIKNFQDYTPNDARTFKKATFEITKAPLTIKPTSLSFKVGDAMPSQAKLQAELQYTTLLGQDVKQDGTPNYRNNPAAEKLVAPTVNIVETTNQGIYELVIDAPAANFANYEVKKTEKGLLTFGVNQLHIYADNQEVYYGQKDVELTSHLSYTDGGEPLTAAQVAELDNVLKPTGTLVYSLSRAEGKDAGDYEITIEGPKALSGYAVLYHSGWYTIMPRPVSLRANTQHKVYGEEDPELTIRVQDDLSNQLGANGLQYDDKAEDVFIYTWRGFDGQNHTTPIYTVTREAGENVGSYKISVEGIRQLPFFNADAFKNYAVSYGNDWNWIINGEAQGRLYITKRPMTVKVVNAEKFYGENDPEVWEVEFEEQSEGRGLVVRTETYTTGWGPWQQTYEVEVPDQIDDRDWVISREGSRTDANRNGENAGDYDLVIGHSKVTGTDNNTNYNPNYEIITANGNGVLTIKKAILNVTAKDQGIDYGKDINSSWIPDYQGNKVYAYTWEIEEGQMVNQGLWIERPKAGRKTLNDQIEDLITLEATTTRVGTHAPETEPYKLVKSELCETNYVINFTQAYLSIAPLEEIPLDEFVEVFEGKEVALTQVLEDHRNVKVGFRMPSNRTFKDNTWYTLVLPFDIRVRDLSAALGYAVVDIFDQDNNTNDVKLKLFVNTLKANEPFIVKVDEEIKKAQMKTINFGGKKFEVADAEFNYATEDPIITDKSGNSFTGTYAGKSPMATDEYFIAGNSGTFYTGQTDVTWSIKQTEAYLKKGSANGGALRIYIEEPDGTTTIIEGVEAASEAAEAEAAEGWYTVTGVKLEAEPTTTGTYIFNGKKVFIQK